MSVRPVRKGEQTRQRIMDVAQGAILQKGFASTSIEEILVEAVITKSGFFYHFKDKNDLAKALLQRYLTDEDGLFDELLATADSLDEDPLHGFLIFLKLLADRLADIPNGHPGCLVAAYCYQDQLFSREIRELGAEGFAAWRRRFRKRFDLIAQRHPAKLEINLDALADMLSSIAGGAIILSKSMHDPKLLPQQILLYRSFVRLAFVGTA